MALYGGIDLHSNNHVVVIDEEHPRVVEKRLPDALSATLQLREPYRDELMGIVVESTFNWYGLVDELMAAGFLVRLANTVAIRQYDGVKHIEDRYDAFFDSAFCPLFLFESANVSNSSPPPLITRRSSSQFNGECCTGALVAFDGHCAPMRFHEPFDHRQANPPTFSSRKT